MWWYRFINFDELIFFPTWFSLTQIFSGGAASVRESGNYYQTNEQAAFFYLYAFFSLPGQWIFDAPSFVLTSPLQALYWIGVAAKWWGPSTAL